MPSSLFLRAVAKTRIGAAAVAFSLVFGFSIVPTDTSLAASLSASAASGSTQQRGGQQRIYVDSTLAAPVISIQSLTANGGVDGYARTGTNQAWAQLVLYFGGWPQTNANVSVILQWMRQENGPQDWWNRNNPLNNGYGSGGGSGFGSYSTLVSAADYCAQNLQRGYPAIVSGLQSGTSAATTAAAIWASPWSTSHYGDGTHWSTSAVQIVQAPASAWGL